jgi:SAM-dependent methyltransferase
MTEVGEDWDEISQWWIEEVANDHVHTADIQALLGDLLDRPRGTILDLGCGEGQWLRRLAATEGPDLRALGCDLSTELVRHAATSAPVVRCRLPDLRWLREGALDAAFSVYVLDLIEDLDRFFVETARVVASGGSLNLIVNHPVFTAPGSYPVVDETGESYFRWGEYFEAGSTTEPAGDLELRFQHRSMGRLLTAAASAGWVLERLEERGLSDAVVATNPVAYRGQTNVPRILGVRWRRATR